MIRPEQIPDEVVEALHSLFAWIGNSDGAREAIAAALNAWEGATTEPRNWRTALVLPLPKEPSDD
jgi:hypothetical protein